jgi:hypothetical protein
MDISDLGESLFSAARRFLQCDATDPELRAVCYNFLCSLGFDLQQLDSLPIGIFPNPQVMKEELLSAGFSGDEIIASGLANDPRVAGRLIGPIRDLTGQIINFWARHPEGLHPKYLFFRRGWQQEVPAFGLDVALSGLSDRQCELLLVEDLLDALLLQSAGLPQIAATLDFSRSLTAARWERLSVLGVKRATLVPSDEHDGLTHATSAREASLQGGPAPEVFVLLPECFGEVKGLAKLIRAMNHDLFWAWLRDNRVPRTDDLWLTESGTEPEVNLFAGGLDLPMVGPNSSEPQTPTDLVIAPMPETQRRHLSGLCPLHHCDPMFCFCWD